MLTVEVGALTAGRRVLSRPQSFSVSPGSIALVVGPNGCGKSLLLDMLTGLVPDGDVTLSIDGRILSQGSAFRRWKSGLRRLFQAPQLPDELLVEDALARASLETDLQLRHANSILDEARIDTNRTIGSHSFGQRRVIELFLALRPGLCYLLDEPFSSLHPDLANRCAALIRSRCAEGSYAIVTDHLFGKHASLYDTTHEWKLAEESQKPEPIPSDVHDLLASRPNVLPPWQPTHTEWCVENLSIHERHILHQTTLDLPPGTFLAISGGNGSGKSTLLRALIGLRQPFNGVSIAMKGQPPTGATLFSPQPPKLLDLASVRQNLSLMMSQATTSGMSIPNSVTTLLDWFGLPLTLLNQKAEVLSGGEAAIVALVGACVGPAPILLLDEPIESMTMFARSRALALLKATLNQGKSIIASTQHPDLLRFTQAGGNIALSSSEALTGRWTGTRFVLSQDTLENTI